MKKIFILLSIFLIILTSCSSSNVNLASNEWTHYSNELSEATYLSFNNKTAYSVWCECQTHMHNSGKYSYDKKSDLLRLSETVNKILYLDKHYLILKENNAVKTYRNTAKLPYDEYAELAAQYINGKNSPYLTILNFENNKLTVAPYDYDADAKDNFKDYITKIDCADNISFLSVTYKNDNGNETIECQQLPKSDYKHIGEFYTTGYLIFDDNGKITSIVFYGELLIQG